MMFRPSAKTYKYLVDNLQAASKREFAEQDMLNDVYKGKVSYLNSKCNVILPPGMARPVTHR